MTKLNYWHDTINPLLSIDAKYGLPEEVFLAISTLVPIVNVDLLIINNDGCILLSRRNDLFFGNGWHLPGGCVRFKETMEERLQKTALTELSCNVTYDSEPIAVRDVIIKNHRNNLKNNNYRAHHLAILFKCYLPFDYIINNGNKSFNESGFLKWFNILPDDFLLVHDVYKNIINTIMLV